MITAQVVDHNIIVVALVANVAEFIFFTAKNINIAGTLIEMIMINTFLTGLSI